MERMTQQQDDGLHAGGLRDVDFNYSGGIGEDQVTKADELLAKTLPHVEKNTDIFGTVDTSAPLSLSPEEMIEIPSLDGSVESERSQKDNALLESLMAKEIQAQISGDPEEEGRISAQIKLLQSRMNPN